MKKVLTSIIIIASFLFYALIKNGTQEAATLPTVGMKDATTPALNSDDGSTITQFPTTAPTDQLSQSTPPTGQYKDGFYTGPIVDAFYGNIQVRATIKNGKLSDVEFLQYPNDQRESLEISSFAMPALRQEAIQAQSASVDTVTRATDSSEAFRVSLKAALQLAKS